MDWGIGGFRIYRWNKMESLLEKLLTWVEIGVYLPKEALNKGKVWECLVCE